MSKRVLLVAATTGYQVRVFAAAAEHMGLDLILATDRCHVLEDPWGDRAVPLRFEDPGPGIEALREHGPFDGVVAVGDQPALVAARAAAHLGLRFHPPEAVNIANHKFLSRERFLEAGLPTPAFTLVTAADLPGQVALEVRYPCVLKPVSFAASRGVIRAGNPSEFERALSRIRKLVEKEYEPCVLVEDFIPGREYALEGLMTNGSLQTLALFDKPDPLDGPFFEETIYVTPSRESPQVQTAIFDTVARAAAALGLEYGPVHAEVRVNRQGVWMLEIAARPIGGLCSQVLRFKGERSLEEVILGHAVGDVARNLALASGAHGVMMIPIPCAGVYRGVEGVEAARGVPGIEDVVIAAKEGQRMVPLPEGSSYLGFIFARGHAADVVDGALRAAHAALKFNLAGTLPVVG